MLSLAIMGGIGTPEILMVLILFTIAGFEIISPILLMQERKWRKYW